ncbi:helix-turn-helix domain-containing protein [Novispirillum sp. DQ9]|uniref:helix-turn-helix domain-containing protein n=1 Tax=Novispirillum sp. DQ9 TaxID=3398612 RepID=UPI003C7DC185
MRQIDDYVDLAKTRNNITSDNQLARRMNINHSSISTWRNKKAWPAERTMLDLADLAGIPRTIALLELNYWRSVPEAQSTYKTILEELHAA